MIGGLEIPLPCRVPDWVRLARRHVPDALVTAGAWARLAAIDDPLPALASEAALECRLGPEGDRVDFELCLRAPCRDHLSEALRDADLGEDPAWRRPAALLRAWCDPDHLLHGALHAIWLEFDVPEDGDGAAEPFAVATLDAERFYASGTPDVASLERALRAALDPAADGLDPEAAEALTETLRSLPASAQVLHAAARPAPTGSLVRLVVRMPWRRVPRWLESAGWSGSTRALEGLLERLCPSTLVHSFNLDLGPRLLPRVGIEFHHPTPPCEDARWRAVLDALEEAGACSPAKRRALEAWGAPDRLGPGAPGSVRFHRELLVKVVQDAGVPPAAKAYLPFSTRLSLGPAGNPGA